MGVNKSVKYLLFVFNLLFCVCGSVILGVGIHLKVTNFSNTIIKESLPSIELMIAIGATIVVLGILGCCGVKKENRCLLLLFFILLLLIFILLLVAGILAATGKNSVKDKIMEEMKKFQPLSDQPENVIQDVEKMQKQLQCCGLTDGPQEWTKVPDSCRCDATTTNQDTCNAGIYKLPCYDKVIKLIQSNLKVALGIAFVVAILLIFGLALSMVLFCQINK